MTHFKKFALLAALALSGAAFAVDALPTTVNFDNNAVDTIVAGDATLTWDVGDAEATGDGSLEWTTPASGPTASYTRKISVQIDASDRTELPTGITALRAVSSGTDGKGEPKTVQTLSFTEGKDLITAIPAYVNASSTITYTADVNPLGFTNSSIVLNYTISAEE